MAKKKKGNQALSIGVLLVLALVIYWVMRIVLYWLWKLVFFALCIGVAYLILRALGIFSDGDEKA
ncbi:MAG: hypothetical protein KC609_03110 [Myxococcales bacterium]|nr:hypothetical protein [Myxococcales bacterium]